MVVDFSPDELGIARKSLDLAEKGFDAASKAYAKVGLSSFAADVEKACAETAREQINAAVGRLPAPVRRRESPGSHL